MSAAWAWAERCSAGATPAFGGWRLRRRDALVGPRLTLRCFRPQDTDDVFRYASDWAVATAAGWEPHRSRRDSVGYIQRVVQGGWGPTTLAVELTERRQVIGVVDLRVASVLWRIAEIGYSLGRAHWGHGFGGEAAALLLDHAFHDLGMRRVRAACDPANRRSFRIMEKLGMVREVDRVSVVARGGRRVERLVYSIGRAEWPGAQQVTG